MKYLNLFLILCLVLSSSCSKENVNETAYEFTLYENDTYSGKNVGFKTLNGILEMSLGDYDDRYCAKFQILTETIKEGNYSINFMALVPEEEGEATVYVRELTGGTGLNATPIDYRSSGGNGGILSFTRATEDILEGNFDIVLRNWSSSSLVPFKGSFVIYK